MTADPAAVPPRTSCCQHSSDCAQHNAPAEPVGPCDCGKGGPPCGGEPVPPPEWALDAAHEYFSDQWTHLGIPNGIAVNVSPLARLLASVREGETASKDRAYAERNRLVALIASLYPSSLERHDDADKSWEDDWRWIVFIDLPTGQASWHIHDSHLPMFDHVPRFAGRKWDGHTTEEKYARIALLHTPPSGGA